MPKRQPRSLPRLWLMTDERMGDALLASIAALPRGSGIIFRHYSLEPATRRALFETVRSEAKRRRHLLLLGGAALEARRLRADGAHGPTAKRHPRIQTAPVHSVRERIAAERAGADLLFVSPVFATPSHPRARALGLIRLGLLIRGAGAPVIALGGMTKSRANRLRCLGIYGWAAISALAAHDPQPKCVDVCGERGRELIPPLRTISASLDLVPRLQPRAEVHPERLQGSRSARDER